MAADTDELPGHEKLTWVDQIKAHVQPTLLQTDSSTGEVYNPKRRWMQNRIQQRIDEEKSAGGKKGSSGS